MYIFEVTVYRLRGREESFQFFFYYLYVSGLLAKGNVDKLKVFKAFYGDYINLLILDLNTARSVCT